jgi:hypothetical protein
VSVQISSAPAVAKLSTLDRLLPIWILLAMAVGLLAGRETPGLGPALDSVSVAGVSLPIALGLLVMMYPVLAKVRYDRLDTVTGDRRLLVTSLLLNWIAGPPPWAGSTSTDYPAGSGCHRPIWPCPPGTSPVPCWSSSASRWPPATCPAGSANAPADDPGTNPASCPASARSPSTAFRHWKERT